MTTIYAKLRIHHGGNFVRDGDLRYVGGQIETIEEDTDFINVIDLVKFITKGRYGHIQTLSYKLPNESLEEIRPLLNDDHTRECIRLACISKIIDIYVEHAIEEPEIVSFHDVELPLPLPEPDGGVITQPDELNDDCDFERTDVSDNEGSDGNERCEQNGSDGNERCEQNDPAVDDSDHESDHGNGAAVDESEHVNGNVASRRGKYKVAEPIGEDGDVQNVYYDSDNPPSYHSEIENEEAQFQPDLPRQRKCDYPSYKPDSEDYELEIGKYYADANQFKKAATDYAVHYKRDICYYKNDPGRVMLRCAGVRGDEGEKCPFKCTASWEERVRCFQIKTLEPEHMCNQQYELRVVSQNSIEDKYKDMIRKNPCIGNVELKKHIEAELKISVCVYKVARAIRSVKKKIHATFDEQFKKIRDYAQECINSNPGSTVKIKTNRATVDSPCVFQRIYVCFDALKKGFLQGCRKVIRLDGCFLKGLMKGEILSAVGRDANNQMYPIAWAVVEIENTDSWRWFLQLLKTDLGIENTYPWTIISDQQKGLTNVIQELFPDSEHRNCARHVHANSSKKHRGMVMKNHFWKLAKSTTEEQFQQGLTTLGKKDKAAKDDLERYPPKFWCKAFFW